MACALLLNTACSDENVESRTPVASIQYDTNKTTLKVNESLVIDFTGVADLVAILAMMDIAMRNVTRWKRVLP